MKLTSCVVCAAALFASSAAFAVSPLLREIEDAFVALSEKVGPAVVEITVEPAGPSDDDNTVQDFFRFFNPEGPEGRPPQNGRRLPATGSGFVYDTQGHIITNNHVVENAGKITVQLHDGSEHEAVVVGTDPGTDLAVIKVELNGVDLTAVTIGNSDDLKIGQFAIAMGSPRGLTGSVSFGHISGLGREDLNLPDDRLRFRHFIQTDAAINLGNSGGPLCDIDGNVIGVNIAIVVGANSIGFAIPINRVKEIVPQLIDSGRIVRGWLGVAISDISDAAEFDKQTMEDFIDAYGLQNDKGAYVQKITWRGPAEKSGLHTEDVIWKIDAKPVKNKLDLIDQISDVRPGTTVTLHVWRESKQIEVPVKVAEFPGIPGATFGEDILGMHVMNFAEFYEDRRSRQTAMLVGIKEDSIGVVITAVVPKSPAREAQLRPPLIVDKVAFTEVTDKDQLVKLILENAKPGKSLLFHVMQKIGDKSQKKYVTIPEDFSAE